MKFVVILSEVLPPDVEIAYAHFGNNAPVAVHRINGFNLMGSRIPGKFQSFLSNLRLV